MGHHPRFVLSVLFILLELGLVFAACTPSTKAGYSCSLQASGSAYVVHWSASTTSFSMALEVQTTGWVAVGWSATGMMRGDAVIANVAGSPIGTYSLTGTSLAGVQPSSAFSISNTSVSTSGGTTTVSFTRNFDNSGMVPVSASGDNILIWAHSSSNSNTLADHLGSKGRFSLNFGSGTTSTTPAGSSGADDDDEEGGGGGGRGRGGGGEGDGGGITFEPSGPAAPSPPAGSGCTASQLAGYTCVVSASGDSRVLFHWTPPSSGSKTISMALEAASTGWAAVGWSPDGRMANSDAVVASGSSALSVQPYYLGSGAVQPTNSFNPTNASAESKGGKIIMRFQRSVGDGGTVPFSAARNTLIWALGSSKTISNHGPSKGSFSVDFSSSSSTPSTTSPGSSPPSSTSPTSPPASSAASGGCTPSTLAGYACVVSRSGSADSSMLFHWTPPPSGSQTISMAFEVPTTGWASVGFSSSGGMVGSDAVVASGASSLSCQGYYLGGTEDSSVRPTSSFPVVNASAERGNGKIIMRFQRSVGDGGSVPVSAGQNKLIWAYGSSSAISYHGGSRGSFSVNFASGSSFSTTSAPISRAYYDAHAWLLWGAFGVLMPLGIFVARHGQTPRLDPAWFYAHMALQSLGWLATTVGVIIALSKFHVLYSVHAKLGLAAAAAIWVMPFLGLIRPHKGKQLRPYWFALHWTLGTFGVALGWVTIFYGLQLYSARWSQSVHVWTVLFAVQVAVISFIYLALGVVLKLRPSGNRLPMSSDAPAALGGADVSLGGRAGRPMGGGGGGEFPQTYFGGGRYEGAWVPGP